MPTKEHWYTAAQKQYIEDSWGTVSIKGIAKNLGKSVTAIMQKAQHMGLSDARFSGEGITVCQLAKAIGREYSVLKFWILKHGFPAKKKLFAVERRVLYVQYADFWKWAEEYKDSMNFSKFEENMLGPEPAWAKEKRRADIMAANKSTTSVDWTPLEDKQLLRMVESQRYTYPQLAAEFNRAETAIKRRIHDLGTKARPLRLDNHTKWTNEQTEVLKKLATAGYGYNTIAAKVTAIGPEKSELAVRGKLERMKFDFKRRRLPIELNG